MGTKTGMRICALLLAVFLLLGAVPIYNMDLIVAGEDPSVGDSSAVPVDGQDDGSYDEDQANSGTSDGESGESEPSGESEGPGNSEASGESGGAETSGGPEASGESGDSIEPEDSLISEESFIDSQYIITRIIPDYENLITAPVGTAPGDLGLPEKLNVEAQPLTGDAETVATSGNVEQGNVEQVNVEWVCDNYDPAQFGTYTFIAVLPQGWGLGEGVSRPQITVQLVVPIRPLAAGGFTVKYTIGGSEQFVPQSQTTTFQAALNAIGNNTLVPANADAGSIVLEVHTSFQSGSVTMPNRPFTIAGNPLPNDETLAISFTASTITFNNAIAFKDITLKRSSETDFLTVYATGYNVVLDNAHLVGQFFSVKTIRVDSPSSIKLPAKESGNYYIAFSGYGPDSPPLTGETLTLLTNTDKQTANDDWLIVFRSPFSVPDDVSARMILQIKLGSEGVNMGYHSSMMARWVRNTDTSLGLYRLDLHSPPVMVTHNTGSTLHVDFFDHFDRDDNYDNTNRTEENAVNFVNGLTGATDITISLRKGGITSNGELPANPAGCVIKSDPYDGTTYTLQGPSGGFTLNSDVTLCDVGLAGGCISCGTHTLSIYDGVESIGSITGAGTGTGGTLNVFGDVTIPGCSNLEEINIGSETESPVVTVNSSLAGGSLTTESGSQVTAGTVDCDKIDIKSGASLTATATVTYDETLTMSTDAVLEASSVTGTGTVNTLTMRIGAEIKAKQVNAGTLVTNGGKITYSGTGDYAAPYILSIAENNGLTGSLTLSVPEALRFNPSITNRIIRVPNGHAITFSNITLQGDQFDDFALGLDVSDPFFDYYVLKPVVASLTYKNTPDTYITNKYTSFADALGFLDTLTNTYGELPQLNLWKEAELTGGVMSDRTATKPCIIIGHKPGIGTPAPGDIKALYSNTNSIILDRDVEFRNINLGMTGGSGYELAADSHALTIGENVKFITGSAGAAIIPDITGIANSSLTVNSGLQTFNCGNISGFGSVTLTNSNVECDDITNCGNVTLANSNAACSGDITGSGNVAFTDSTVTCGDITGSGSIGVTGSDIECGTISGFAGINFTGTNAIELDQLVVSGSLSATTYTTLTFTSSGTANANIIFDNDPDTLDIETSLAGFSGLTVENLAATDVNHKLIRIPVFSEYDFIEYIRSLTSKISLGDAYIDENYVTFTLRPKGDAPYGYFILSAPVGRVDLTLSDPDSSVTYGDLPLSFTAELLSTGGTSITGWLPGEAEVEFWLCDSSGNLTQPLDDKEVEPDGTATLTVTHAMYKSKLNAGTHYIAAVFYNQPNNPDDSGKVQSSPQQLTVLQQELTVNYYPANSTDLSRIYNGADDTSLPTTATAFAAEWQAVLVLNSGGILSDPDSGAQDDVHINYNTGTGGTNAEFTNGNVETSKQIKYTNIGLTGADSANYKPVCGNFILDTGVSTNWRIERKQLVNVTNTSGAIAKVYDGNTNITTTLNFTSAEVVAGDTVYIKPVSAVYADKNAGANIPIVCADGWEFVGTSPVHNNYMRPTSATTSLTGSITQRPLYFVASPVDGVNNLITKVYDGSNAVRDPVTQIDVNITSGLVSGEEVNIYPVSATFSGVNANIGDAAYAAGVPEASRYNVTPVIAMEATDGITNINNYQLIDTPAATAALAQTGVITKADATANYDEINIQTLYTDTPMSDSYNLNGIILEPVTPSPYSMTEGSRTYEVTDPTDPSFFESVTPPDRNPRINGNRLEYDIAQSDTVNETGSRVTVTVKSQNYEDVDVVFRFTLTDKTRLTISELSQNLPQGKVYDDSPISGYAGTPTLTESDTGLPYNGDGSIWSQIEYYYTDEDDYTYPADPNDPSTPVNAGTYTLWAEIDADYPDYMGKSELGTVTISPRGLIIMPEDKTIDLADLPALLLNPGTLWAAYTDFKAAPIAGDTGLVGGTTLSAVFGVSRAPYVTVSHADPGDNTPRTAAITDDIANINLLVRDGNYTVIDYEDGTLIINGNIANPAGVIMFDPDSPSGSNDWHIRDIKAWSTDPLFNYIGVSYDDNLPDTFYDSSTGVMLSVEGSGGVTPKLYLANGTTPTLITNPYSGFTYYLDKTPPTLTNIRFDQQGEDWGILSVKAEDAISGINGVTVSFNGGAVTKTMTGPDNDGNYSCTVYRYNQIQSGEIGVGATFTYTITAEDVAGHTETLLGNNEFYDTANITGIAVYRQTLGGKVPVGDTLRLEKDEIADLIAEIETSNGQAPTGSYLFHWSILDDSSADMVIAGSNAENAGIKALLPVHPELAERSKLLISAMGVEIAIDISFCTIVEPADATQDIPYPGVVLPAGIHPDTVLIIEKLEDETYMQTDMQANLTSLLNGYPDWKTLVDDRYINSRWLHIWLMDTSGNEVQLPADSNLEIYLPHTSVSSAANDYLMIHQYNGGLDNLTLNKNGTGISFSVDGLSPFAMIWKAAGGGVTSYTVTFDLNGGTRTGGGDLIQTVTAGGAATAPTVTRSGYIFNGWDKIFSNVTADMTVTAQWTQGGGDPNDPNDPNNPNPDPDPDPNPDPDPDPNPDPDPDPDPDPNPTNPDSGNSYYDPNSVHSWLSRLNGGAGGSGLSYDDFWYQVRKAIRAANPGDTVLADVPTHINTCPISVLIVLKDKDVTLQIKWLGKEFSIYGKDVLLPEPLPDYYLLSDLFKLYGKSRPVSIRPQDLQNPEMGGDDIMIISPTGDLRLTLPVLPGISRSDRLVHSSGASPVLPDVPSSINVDLTGKSTASPTGGWNMAASFAILISLAMMATVLTRGNALYLAAVKNISILAVPAAFKPGSKAMAKTTAAAPSRTVAAVPNVPAAVKPGSKAMAKTAAAAPLRPVAVVPNVPTAVKSGSKATTKAVASTATSRTISAVPDVPNTVKAASKTVATATSRTVSGAPAAVKPGSKAMTKTAAPAPSRTVSAVPGVPNAVRPGSQPSMPMRTVSAAPVARASSPASLSDHNGTDKKFFTLIDRHRLLQQDLENGLITREEYEIQKRKLACCF